MNKIIELQNQIFLKTKKLEGKNFNRQIRLFLINNEQIEAIIEVLSLIKEDLVVAIEGNPNLARQEEHHIVNTKNQTPSLRFTWMYEDYPNALTNYTQSPTNEFGQVIGWIDSSYIANEYLDGRTKYFGFKKLDNRKLPPGEKPKYKFKDLINFEESNPVSGQLTDGQMVVGIEINAAIYAFIPTEMILPQGAKHSKSEKKQAKINLKEMKKVWRDKNLTKIIDVGEEVYIIPPINVDFI